MVVAHDLAERRKGSALLGEVLRQIRRRPLTVVTLGNGHISVSTQEISVCELGYVDHERTKALAYSAADMLLHPALVDNLPNVVVEAISCGTPCAAFPIGGLPDIVQNGISGWLATKVTPESLAGAVDTGLECIAQERTCARVAGSCARTSTICGCRPSDILTCFGRSERRVGTYLRDLRFLTLNLVGRIPSQRVRHALYRQFGMTIGRGSVIYNSCEVREPGAL